MTLFFVFAKLFRKLNLPINKNTGHQTLYLRRTHNRKILPKNKCRSAKTPKLHNSDEVKKNDHYPTRTVVHKNINIPPRNQEFNSITGNRKNQHPNVIKLCISVPAVLTCHRTPYCDNIRISNSLTRTKDNFSVIYNLFTQYSVLMLTQYGL